MANETLKKRKDRSVAYPSLSLPDAINSATQLKESMGKGPYSRTDAAKGIGHVALTGPAARKIAALVQYGLLDRHGNTYSLTDLVQEITKPIDEETSQAAIARAARSPKLFDKLIERYSNQALPTMLENIVIREGVSESAAKEVVRIFNDTLSFSKLLVNGVVTASPTSTAVSEKSEDEEIPPASYAPGPVNHALKVKQVSPSVSNNFVFDFAGGIQLVIPRTQKTSDAIADGELKDIRQALAKFANDFMTPNSDTTDES